MNAPKKPKDNTDLIKEISKETKQKWGQTRFVGCFFFNNFQKVSSIKEFERQF